MAKLEKLTRGASVYSRIPGPSCRLASATFPPFCMLERKNPAKYAAPLVPGRTPDQLPFSVAHHNSLSAAANLNQDLAGHVSKDMVKHYSHIRTEAKRRAVEVLPRSAGIRGADRYAPDIKFRRHPQVGPVN